ncbi:MAG: GIY-YIG nuclease family protein, partial [Halobacteriovoraceae bacterium]|nr:GIY-YIG nuclease family protein [Halobacteriovoraceae bacterium]
SHHLKRINTRKYYEGLHFLEVIVNGISLEKHPFVLWIEPSPYSTYMLLTEQGTIYTGVTTDFNRRYEEHCGRDIGKKGAKYTKANRPKYPIYLEKSENRSLAQKRESAIKKLTRKQKESLSWLAKISL